MSDITNIALDAMGGDNAPAEMIKGAVDAIAKEPGMKVFLVGQEDAIQKELVNYQYNKEDVYKRQLCGRLKRRVHPGQRGQGNDRCGEDGGPYHREAGGDDLRMLCRP